MILAEIQGLNFKYNAVQLFNNVTFRVGSDEHTALIGKNGTGKTTLLKLLNNILQPDEGKVEWLPNTKVGYLDQFLEIDPKITAIDYVFSVYINLINKEKRKDEIYETLMSIPPDQVDKQLIIASEIEDELIRNNYYGKRTEIEKTALGLGIPIENLSQSISELSGGTIVKLMLCKILLNDYDIILLDEPTNYLDKDQIVFLKKYLNNYKKAFIVISHDLDFLKDIATTILSLENKVVTKYQGNYDFYLKESLINKENYQKQYQKEQAYVKTQKEFIAKNIARATTSTRAQSRQKMLEKLTLLKAPVGEKQVFFNFPDCSFFGDFVLDVTDLEIGYSHPLIDKINLKIAPLDVVLLIGKNGVGKSTFVKTILSQIQGLSGEFKWHPSIKISYLAQNDDSMDDLTSIQIILNSYPDLTINEVMNLLARFGINYELANRLFSTLSGGERTKTRLALISKVKSNCLILDEPTNHLDTIAKTALQKAILDYNGTVILVSHEKSFYENIVTKILEFS